MQPNPFAPRVRILSDEPRLENVVSQLCTHAQMTSPEYLKWRDVIREGPQIHRKVWEFCYILAALDQHMMLRPGKRALGFGVGREPLASVLAAAGCSVIATDLDYDDAVKEGWATDDANINQHASAVDHLNERGICDPEMFGKLVQFRTANMNDIPKDLRGFDFVWSSCAFEHLGNLRNGLQFVFNSLACIKPGGVAVHTTEFNLSSNNETLGEGGTVLYRRRDIEALAKVLVEHGHQVILNFNPGTGWLDQHFDVPPYSKDNHLKLQIGKYVSTSIGITVRKAI